MARLEALSAVASDVSQLMDAIAPLARIIRYGNVRQTDTQMVARVIDSLVTRVCIGLAGACAALGDDAAEEMFDRIVDMHSALALLQREDYTDAWMRTLDQLSGLDDLHGLVAGRVCRLLIDDGALDVEEGIAPDGTGFVIGGRSDARGRLD